MPKRFNPLDTVRDLETHKRLYVTDWPRMKLAWVKAVWGERNPAYELVFRGIKGKNFTGYMEWRER